MLAFAITVGTLANSIGAVGEELGWRGYMLTRLLASGVPAPILLSGLVWGVWHLPLILSGKYAVAEGRVAASAFLFIVATVSAACVAAYLRLSSGSVWPAVIAHGAWNAVIQGTFDPATVETSLAVGESGYLTCFASILFVMLLYRGRLTSTSAGLQEKALG